MSSRDLEPLPYATTTTGVYDDTPPPLRPARVLGPSTGLPWGVEMVRLNALESAAHHDELAVTYAGRSEFGVGLCKGTAEGLRRVAGDLIRYAPWNIA